MTIRIETGGTLPEIINNTEGLYEGDLVAYFRAIFTKAENLNLPYHNFRHMMHVTWLCHEACRFYRDRLNGRQMRQLLIAAMFHDFNHTGRYGNDDHNIMRALRGLETHCLPCDQSDLLVIGELVKATEYPPKRAHSEFELPAQILCDADVAQAFSVAWVQQVVFGLAAEWGHEPKAVLATQQPFLRGLSFSTEWAKKQFPREVIEAKIAEAKALSALLG